MLPLLKCNLMALMRCDPMSAARVLEFNNVGVHKADIGHNRTSARHRAQYAFVDPSLFRHCSIEHRNAEPDRAFVPARRSCSAAFRGPLMTVDSIKGSLVDCFWTGMDGAPNAESFPADVLQNF
jgi:hypothetical protein